MKKIISVLLSVLMLFCFSGCNLVATELDEEDINGLISDLEELEDDLEDWSYEEWDYEDDYETAVDEESADDEVPEEETSESTEATEESVTEAVTEETTTVTEATTTTPEETTTTTTVTEPEEELIDEDGVYTTKDDVALYIHTYGKLPKNFITKKEAQALGWEGGSLEPYAPGMCIGGSYFGNYEGLLPEKDGRKYTECDIDTLGKSKRGAKRIVFSNDGLIYYTDDHYETFELLYGEE